MTHTSRVKTADQHFSPWRKSSKAKTFQDIVSNLLTWLYMFEFWFQLEISPSHRVYFDGSVQNCSNSIANALELLQSCTKPSICTGDRSSQVQIMAWQRIGVTWLPEPMLSTFSNQTIMNLKWTEAFIWGWGGISVKNTQTGDVIFFTKSWKILKLHTYILKFSFLLSTITSSKKSTIRFNIDAAMKGGS